MLSDKSPRLDNPGENMKTNKKVLVILLAFAGTQSASLAEKCKQISQSPSITVCVTAKTPTDTVDRTTLTNLKQAAVNLLSAEKRALAKKPKAILAPHIIPTVIAVPETSNNQIIIEEGIPELPTDTKYEQDPDLTIEDPGF